MDISKIERKLTKKVRHILKKISLGYKVIYSYNDGCDEYGSLTYVSCINGFEGGSWEINDACDNNIISKKLTLINNGIKFNGVNYFIHSDLYNKNYYDKDLVKIISKEEHDKLLAIKIYIDNIIEKIKNEIEIYELDNKKTESNDIMIYNHNIFRDAKSLLYLSPRYNYGDFVKYIKNNKYGYKSRH